MIAKAACSATMFLFGAFGCAPTQSGTNQVSDINYLLTADKDRHFSSRFRADEAMKGLVEGQKKVANGCALGLVRDGRIIYVRGYGFANGNLGSLINGFIL